MQNSIVFGLTASAKLAKEVAELANIPFGEMKVSHFADNEVLVVPMCNVRGKDVIIIQSVCRPVNDNLMELLIAIDALKRASAKSVNLICPYLGYARQDRKSKAREPISFKLVANLLTKAGADRILTFDLHSAQTQGFFDIPFDNLEASWTLISALLKKHHDLEKITVVSPDYGSTKRSREISDSFKWDLAIVDKRRPEANKVEICNILGEVKDRDCIIVDDMIDTGGTMLANAKLIKSLGARRIFVLATHALFNRDCLPKFQAAIADGTITEVFVTNTIEREPVEGITQVNIAKPLVAACRIYSDGTGSMTHVFDAAKYAKVEKINNKLNGNK